MNILKLLIQRLFKTKPQMSGAQFTQRPSRRSISTEPDWWKNRLFCYSGKQSALHFGQNRHSPVKTRRIITLKKRDHFWIVLPATGKEAPNFFCLYRAQCDCYNDEDLKSLYDKSYLCPRAETVLPAALIREVGVINHIVTPEILTWYKTHLQGAK